MSDELTRALETLSERGRTAGATAVATRAISAAETVRPRRRAPLLLGAAALVTAVSLVLGVVYIASRTDRIRRIDVTAALGGTASGGPTTVLLVGTDAREGVEGARADVIMLLRIDPGSGRAAILSLPRDLLVSISGTETKDRLSTALGGRLITTVRDTVGVGIDHYVQVDFDGFRRIVDAVGGVRMPFAAPTRDALSGLSVAAGCVTLGGEEALAFVRSRHLETLEAGQWRVDPTGDLGRIARQQMIVRNTIDQLAARAKRDPLALKRVIDAFVAHTTIDSSLSTKRLLLLATELRKIPASQVAMLTLPTVPATVGGAAVLTIDQPSLASVLATFAGAGAGGGVPASSASARSCPG